MMFDYLLGIVIFSSIFLLCLSLSALMLTMTYYAIVNGPCH